MAVVAGHHEFMGKVASGYTNEIFEESGVPMTAARRWHYANQSIEANPGMAWPYMVRSVAFLRMSRPWEAVSDLDKALRCSSRSDDSTKSRSTHRGTLLSQDLATHRRDRFPKSDDQEARIRLLRGYAHSECLSYDRAAADFAAAAEILTAVENDTGDTMPESTEGNIRLRPAHAKAGLCLAYCHMRRWSDAIRTGEIALQHLSYDDASGIQAAQAVDTARQHLASERRGAARIATEASRQVSVEQQQQQQQQQQIRATNKRVHSYRGSLNNVQSPLRKLRTGSRHDDVGRVIDDSNIFQHQHVSRDHNLGGSSIGPGNTSNMSMSSLPKNLSITSIAMSLSMASINSDTWELPEPTFHFHSQSHHQSHETSTNGTQSIRTTQPSHSINPSLQTSSLRQQPIITIKNEPQPVSSIHLDPSHSSVHMHDDNNDTDTATGRNASLTHIDSASTGTHISPQPSSSHTSNNVVLPPPPAGADVDDDIGLDI